MIYKLIKKGKRYQERIWAERVILWIRYMPWAYIKAIWWYFVKALKWEDVSDDEEGRVKWDTCVGINVGMAQHKMGWYYTFEEVFFRDGNTCQKLM